MDPFKKIPQETAAAVISRLARDLSADLEDRLSDAELLDKWLFTQRRIALSNILNLTADIEALTEESKVEEEKERKMALAAQVGELMSNKEKWEFRLKALVKLIKDGVVLKTITYLYDGISSEGRQSQEATEELRAREES